MSQKRQLFKGLRTRAVHAGESPDPETGASAPNIVMSSTFVPEEPQRFSATNQDFNSPYIYSRWGNPSVRQLEEKLASLEEAERCICFASGMAAISSLLFSLLKPGDQLVTSDINYPGTAELVRSSLPKLGVEVVPVDTSKLEDVKAVVSRKTRLVLIETPANPILRLSDIAQISRIAHRSGAELAVDSTFATPIATRPLALGADYVIHSLTKYIGGHGDAMGGAILGRGDAMREIELEGLIHFGGVISPFNAWLIQRGLATLPIRMDAHEKSAMAVALFLEQHPAVDLVLYPGLSSHPQHELASKQMNNYSGMIAMRAREGDALVERMMKELTIFHYAVSLGHHRSLVYWIGSDDLIASSYKLQGQQLKAYREVAGDGIFRISIGLEDPDDLCADLYKALAR